MTHLRRRKIIILTISGLLLCGNAPLSYSLGGDLDFVWNAGIGNFTTASNWDHRDVGDIPVAPGDTFFINNGGTVQLTTASFGNETFGFGNIGVTVGNSGFMEVSPTGVVNFASFFLGVEAGSTGSLTVEGSMFAPFGTLSTVGEEGTGTLIIKNGGQLISVGGRITVGQGNNGTGTGTITVTGAGSNVNLGGAGQLRVGAATIRGGRGNDATLTISDGGTVSAIEIELAAGTGNKGIINIGAGGAAGILNAPSVVGGNISFPGGEGILNFNHSDTDHYFTHDGSNAGNAVIIEGSTSVNHIGSGSTVLTGVNTYTGGTHINDGTLKISTNNNLGDITGALTFDGGTLQNTASFGSSRTTTLNAGGGTFNTDASTHLSHDGNIGGSGGLSKQGAGILTLEGVNDYTGTTTVNGGTLILRDGAAIADSGAINIISGILDIADAETIGSLAGTGTVNLDENLTVGDATSTTYSGVVQGINSLIKQGAGTLTLAGVNDYSGDTNINGGSLSVSANNNLGDVTGALTFDGGTLQNTASFSSSRTTTLNAGGGTFNTNTSTTLTHNGAIGGTGSLGKQGAGILTLTGVNDYSGGTNINGGSLSVSTNDHLGDVTGVLTFDGGTLQNTASFNSSRTTTLNAGGGTFNTDASTTLAHNGNIGGAGGLNKQGAGILRLDGVNDYTGTTTVNGGTLNLRDGTAIADSGAINIISGILDITDAETIGSLAGTGTVNLDENLTVGDATSTTYSGVVQGGNGLVKQGTGTLTLAGVNDYTGDTNINGGSLSVSANNNLGDATNTLTFDGGTLQSTASFSSSRTTTLNAGGGTFNTDTSTTLTHNGNIGGAGGLSKQGAGILRLTGGNTYNGGTTISAGTLQIGNGGTTGAITGNVTNNSVLTFNRSNGLGFAGVISGTGSVNKLGASSLSLTGANTYSGDTTITAGTLNIGNGGTTGAITGNIINNATLRFLRANNYIYSGDISGNGTVIQTETGTVTLTGNATHTGGTTITTGSLNIGNGGTTGSISGNIIINNNNALTFNRSDALTYSDVISGTGNLIKLGGDTLTLTGGNTYAGGTTISAGTLQIGDGGTTGSITGNVTNNSALTFNRSDALTYSDVISGTGSFTQSGTGSTNLTNTNTYNGTTTINGGTLFVNGSNSNSTTTVNAGGTLGGTGTVGTVNVSGGTFAPGNSIGTTNVAGNVDFSGGGIYQIEVDDAGNSDLINATGTAILTGGSVQVLPEAGSYVASTDYTILTAAGGLGGTVFNSVTSNLAFLDPTLTYDATNVFLNLTRNSLSFSSVASTSNQTALSTILGNNISALADIIDPLLGLTTLGAQQAFNSLSGGQYTHGQQLMLFGLSQQFQQLLFSRINFNSTTSLAFNPMQGNLLAYQGADWPILAASTSLGAQDTLNKERGFWLQGFGSFGEIGADSNASGADYDTRGFAFGVDTDWHDGVIGFAGSYTRSDADTFGGNTEINSFQVAVYGGWEQADVYVNASIGGGYHDAESSRAVVVGGTTSTARAEYDSYNISAGIEVGKNIPLKLTTTLTPYVGLDFNHVDRESFTETGAGTANLSVRDNKEDSLRTRIGLRLSHAITNSDGSQLTPYIYGGYVREFLDETSTIDAAFSAVPTASFNISGVELDRNRAEFGAGITGQLNENTSFNIGYDGNHAGSDDNHAFSATVRFTW